MAGENNRMLKILRAVWLKLYFKIISKFKFYETTPKGDCLYTYCKRVIKDDLSETEINVEYERIIEKVREKISDQNIDRVATARIMCSVLKKFVKDADVSNE